ncbi:MAG TPA: tripartite tricarboxylate transporter substrate binding protein [Ramlibacter sp.]|nr:tripartite tricarboxylate transporter substrate binding protein [Ramlibacter sp.]
MQSFATDRRTVLAALLASLAPGAFAQGFPNGPIKLIYPFPAGSSFDAASRLIAAEASKSLGQSMVVENRPGAAGRLGLAAIQQTPGNGHNLSVVVNGVLVILAVADPSFKFEAGRDYSLVTLALESYGVLIGRKGLPYSDVRGLVAYAKENRGKINFASSGVGSAGHLVIELLKTQAGIDVAHVPYKGETPALADMMAGTIDLMFTTAGAKPHIDSGRIVALATTGPKRWSLFPNLPTLEEQGLQGLIYAPWLGIAAPGGTPRDAIDKLNAAIRTGLQNREARDKLAAMGFEVVSTTPEQFAARIEAEKTLWGPVIRKAGIKFD